MIERRQPLGDCRASKNPPVSNSHAAGHPTTQAAAWTTKPRHTVSARPAPFPPTAPNRHPHETNPPRRRALVPSNSPGASAAARSTSCTPLPRPSKRSSNSDSTAIRSRTRVNWPSMRRCCISARANSRRTSTKPPFGARERASGAAQPAPRTFGLGFLASNQFSRKVIALPCQLREPAHELRSNPAAAMRKLRFKCGNLLTKR